MNDCLCQTWTGRNSCKTWQGSSASSRLYFELLYSVWQSCGQLKHRSAACLVSLYNKTVVVWLSEICLQHYTTFSHPFLFLLLSNETGPKRPLDCGGLTSLRIVSTINTNLYACAHQKTLSAVTWSAEKSYVSFVAENEIEVAIK